MIDPRRDDDGRLGAMWDSWDGVTIYDEANGGAWIHAADDALAVDPDAIAAQEVDT